ncbi:hypothetical protein N786_14360 [Bacillus amyloliquefaciens UASWS BA1]|nr:hypothetical protein N786_14360 [Bacillus amyloliquefaciens UASWS BA1]
MTSQGGSLMAGAFCGFISGEMPAVKAGIHPPF